MFLLYLILSDRGAEEIQKLFIGLYPKYQPLVTPPSSKGSTELAPELRQYLNFVLVLFGKDRLSDIHFPKHRITKSDVALRRDELESKITLEEAEAYRALLRNNVLRSTVVTREQYDTFLRQVSAAMTTDRAITAAPGGINLNENMLDISNRGDVKSIVHVDGVMSQNIRIDGLSPVIIKFTPITNLYLFLGANEAAFNSPSV